MTHEKNAQPFPPNTRTRMQTPSSLSQSVIKGMRKAALETCCHHGNVVITTSSFPPGKKQTSFSPEFLLYLPAGLTHLLILFLDLDPLTLSFLPSHREVPFLHLPLCFSNSTLFQLFHGAPFSLPFCLVTLSSTASIFDQYQQSGA